MVDKKTVEYVANLARIEVSSEEKDLLAPQLSTILDYIDKLKELDVTDIEPTRGGSLEENAFREDIAEEKSFRDEILKNAPASEDGYFKIPKVLE